MNADVTIPDVLDAPELRRAFSAFPTGVVAVCALVDAAPVGMAMNSFTSISLDPPLVAVSVDKASRTWPRLARSEALGLSVLSAGQEQLSRQLSSRSAGDRFAGVRWREGARGAVLVEDAALWLTCVLESTFEGGDHDILVLRVEDVRFDERADPLVFHRSAYHSLGTAPE